MPIRRGHIAPQNTYIDTLIKKFDSQSAKFVIANAAIPNKPIIYCSDGFCSLFNFTKGQLLLKSASLQIFQGKETCELAAKRLSEALHSDTEAEISLVLYKKSRASVLIHIVIAPVRDETGNIPLYILFFREEGEHYVEEIPEKEVLEAANSSFFRRALTRLCFGQKTRAEHTHQPTDSFRPSVKRSAASTSRHYIRDTDLDMYSPNKYRTNCQPSLRS
ncbi:Potassium voltage-gated channel subfamily H member 7 [Cichlidogyrus casuarinus]|uniref:Potassium voltage-gated channel subfamily H member 7 n=1 Tax=Cichlidogyrus casuarinus TaxID=1844966 RepID=A0ABD2Q180_9PLAT